MSVDIHPVFLLFAGSFMWGVLVCVIDEMRGCKACRLERKLHGIQHTHHATRATSGSPTAT